MLIVEQLTEIGINTNCQGMGGNDNHGHNDHFAGAKFTMIPFASNADPEAY